MTHDIQERESIFLSWINGKLLLEESVDLFTLSLESGYINKFMNSTVMHLKTVE